MNQDKVKEILESVRPSPVPFQVIFSGKQSKKVNGLYHPNEHEIIIHNRNFENDGALLYTAFHEYAHHIQVLATGKTGHNKQFWATFNTLLDEAIEKGVYAKPDYDETLELRIADLKKVLKEHATLEAQIGDMLLHLEKDCNRNSVRSEEIIDRELKIKRATHKRFVQASLNYGLFPEESYTNADMVSLVAKSPKSQRREDVELLVEGTNIYAPTMPASVEASDDMDEQLEYVKLAKKRDRLDRTIGRLTEERIRVEHEMQTIQVHNDMEEPEDDE